MSTIVQAGFPAYLEFAVHELRELTRETRLYGQMKEFPAPEVSRYHTDQFNKLKDAYAVEE